MTEQHRQRVAALVSAVSIVVVLSPVANNLRADARDGFPLSHYPMFSADRGRHQTVTSLVGLDRDGRARPLTYRLAGSGGMNQVRRQIRRMVREDRADELCRRVASRASERSGARYRSLQTVSVVSGTYDFRDYFRGNTDPVKEVRHATCDVQEIER